MLDVLAQERREVLYTETRDFVVVVASVFVRSNSKTSWLHWIRENCKVNILTSLVLFLFFCIRKSPLKQRPGKFHLGKRCQFQVWNLISATYTIPPFWSQGLAQASLQLNPSQGSWDPDACLDYTQSFSSLYSTWGCQDPDLQSGGQVQLT